MNLSELNHLPSLLQKQLEQRTADIDVSAKDPLIKSSLSLVWSFSDFVAQSCLRYPDLLPGLESSGDLLRVYAPGELKERLVAQASACESEQELKQLLRQHRRREMVRITWRDLAGWADLPEVVATVSELADASIQVAQEFANAALAENHGQPLMENGDAMSLCVLGMGKLGASELNFSSDIDLIFSYPGDGETRGKRPLTHREYFIRLGKKIIQLLGETTADGFVFRVDMRLRPNGNSGALALSFDAMDQYYLVHGREWERYALIKARVITGKAVGQELMRRLRPFVFRKYIDYTVIENLREMKNRIEHELKRKGIKYNVKLGPGGIREIEFIAQAWQLIRGGRDPELQDRRLLVILERLAQKKLLPEPVVAQLRDAYFYQRRLEHRLQMINDQQTQTLPESVLDQCRIATAMGYDNWEAFMHDWQSITQQVQVVFDDMFHGDVEQENSPNVSAYSDIWLGVNDTADALATLESAGYIDPEAVLQLILGVRNGRAYSVFSSEGKDRMDRLMPQVLESCGDASQPNVALTRIVQILESIGQRSSYIALLAENPVVLTQLVRLATASSWIASWIARHPMLLDELFDPRVLYGELNEDEVRDELRQLLSHIPEDDLENQLNALRDFRHAQMLRVAAADVSSNLDDPAVSWRLCLIAQICLEFCLDIAWADLTRIHGEPGCLNDATGKGFIIVAYGKLGSREMGYTSDLDLVFIHRQVAPNSMTQGERSIADVTFYQRLAQKITSFVTTRTYAGRLYEMDVRLRPNGLSGALASGLESWSKYQRETAWVWEHQALVRARAVTGDDDMKSDFSTRRQEILQMPRNNGELKKAILEMREKMRQSKPDTDTGFNIKTGRGGMVDIEFLVQYLVLRWASQHPEITEQTETTALLQSLKNAGVLNQEDEKALSVAWSLYLRTEHCNKLMDEPLEVSGQPFERCRDEIIRIWKNLLHV